MAGCWFIGKSGGGPPQSKTLRACGGRGSRASVLECGGPPPLSRAGQTVPMLSETAYMKKGERKNPFALLKC